MQASTLTKTKQNYWARKSDSSTRRIDYGSGKKYYRRDSGSQRNHKKVYR